MASRINFSKVLWIYLFAFLLVAFNFNAHGNMSQPDLTKKEVKNNSDDLKSLKDKKSLKEKKKEGKIMLAKFETTLGSFKVKLFSEEAPLTVDNFVGLVEGTKEWTHPKTGQIEKSKRFYDGLTFHRVISGFMIQGGDPLGTGTGGPGFQFKDEFSKKHRFNKPGILAMANAGPGTNGSQFFITVKETEWLNDKHTIFGEVIDGMDVVTAISKVKTGLDAPIDKVIIKSVQIEKK